MKTEVVAQMTKDSTWIHIFFIIIIKVAYTHEVFQLFGNSTFWFETNSSFIDFIELVLSGIGIQFLFLTLGLFGTQG